MQEALHALTDELRRLKAQGVRTVPVSDDALSALRTAVERNRQSAPADRSVATPVIKPAEKAPAPEMGDKLSAKRNAPEKVASKLPPPPTFSLEGESKQERWLSLSRTVVNDPVCRDQLMPGKKVVVGVGDLDAQLFYCGEAPGAEEEVQGEPFVGPAGQKLNQVITAMGLSRERVYIGNIMNWRPRLADQTGTEQVGNRPPNDEELAYCLPYLQAQVAIVQPRVIVALGATAARGLLGPGSFRQVGEVRGRWLTYAGIPLRVTYHPSYLLRQDDMGKVAGMRARRAVWEDMLEVMTLLGMPISDKQRSYFLKA